MNIEKQMAQTTCSQASTKLLSIRPLCRQAQCPSSTPSRSWRSPNSCSTFHTSRLPKNMYSIFYCIWFFCMYRKSSPSFLFSRPSPQYIFGSTSLRRSLRLWHHSRDSFKFYSSNSTSIYELFLCFFHRKASTLVWVGL